MIEVFRIIGIALHHRWRLIGAYTSMVGALIAYVLMPMYFGAAIDEVEVMFRTGSHSGDTILMIVGIILGLSIVRGILSYFQTYLGRRSPSWCPTT